MGQRQTRSIAQEYLSGSTIHGCQLIVKDTLFKLENIGWAMIVALFFCFAGYLITDAFASWAENPVIMTVDNMVHPLSEERFPTITLCSNQIKNNFNNWRFTETALLIIETECKQAPMDGKCPYYLEKKQKIMMIAQKTLLGTKWKDLPFAIMVNMLEFILTENGNETELKQFYHFLTQMTGDPSGKLSPIAMPQLIMSQKEGQVIEHLGIRDVFQHPCTYEKAKTYVKLLEDFHQNKLGLHSPCKRSDKHECCGFLDSLVTRNFEYLMLVMKYTIPSFFVNHAMLAKFLGFDGNKDYGLQSHIANTAPYCSVPEQGGVSHSTERDMRMFWTSDGACASINAPPMSTVFKNTEHLRLANNIFGGDQGDNNYFNGSARGGFYDLDVILDSKTLFITSPFRDRLKSDEAFAYITVNEFDAPFSAYYAKREIQMGQIMTITLSPSILSATDSLRDLKIKDRKCKFKHEVEGLKCFQYYSQEACELECMMKYAISRCGNCIPWNLPFIRPLFDVDVPVCDGFHTRCFTHNVLRNMTHKAAYCKCLPSCIYNQVAITESHQLKELMDDFCDDGDEMGQIYINELIKPFKDPAKYHAAMNENGLKDIIGTNFSDTKQTCQRLIKDEVAILKFQLSRTTAMRIIQDVRVTLTDKIGTFGGTMGLFTGFSLLSAIEIIFYIWKCIQNLAFH